MKVKMLKGSPPPPVPPGLPDSQVAKRTAAELSSGTIVSGKRGRHETPSGSSSGEDSRVFPSDSPNEVSFLNIHSSAVNAKGADGKCSSATKAVT